MFFPLHSRSYSVTTTLLPVRKRQNSLVLLLSWLNLSAFFQSYTWNTTDEHPCGLKRSQKDRGELLKYIIYKNRWGFFTNSVQDRNSSMASKSV